MIIAKNDIKSNMNPDVVYAKKGTQLEKIGFFIYRNVETDEKFPASDDDIMQITTQSQFHKEEISIVHHDPPPKFQTWEEPIAPLMKKPKLMPTKKKPIDNNQQKLF